MLVVLTAAAVTAICLLAGGVSVFGLHGFAAAQGDAPDGPTVAGDAVLRGYLDALAKKRLLAAETGSLPALKKLVQAGERLYLAPASVLRAVMDDEAREAVPLTEALVRWIPLEGDPTEP